MPAWIQALARTDLHVHLEGAIPPGVLAAIAARHGGDPGQAAALPPFHDFRGFLQAWARRARWLRTAEDATEAAHAVAQAWAAAGLTLVEAHCTPATWAVHGLGTGALVAALRAGLDRVPGVRVGLIVDLARDHGPEAALRTAAEAAELADLGVVAVGLGGHEALHPVEPFAPAIALARRRGLHATIHAGETAGPASIRAALAAGAERIGHGIRAIEDPALLADLAREGIPLEVCPTSNWRTGVVRRLADHPLPRLAAAGCRIVLGSDDPVLFGCDLAGELRLCHLEFGLSRPVLEAWQADARTVAFSRTE